MPRYFFDVHDGSSLRDGEGSELADLDAARVAAVQLAAGLLRDNAAKFWTGEEWRIEVKDASSAVLFGLEFRAVDAPARRAAR